MDIINLNEISNEAIDETLKKFSRVLVEGWNECYDKYGAIWRTCKICKEVNEKNENCKICIKICQLAIHNWCKDFQDKSRLHRGYHKNRESYEKDLNDYLWWMTIELELRNS